MSLQDELEELINKHNAELPSGTPDYILARYLMECLESFHFAVDCREYNGRTYSGNFDFWCDYVMAPVAAEVDG